MKIKEMQDRLAAIVAQLGELKEIENHSDEEIASINALSEEFEQLSAKITAAEKIEAITAKADVSTRKVAPQAVTPKVEVGASRQEKAYGFKNLGDFAMAVKGFSGGSVHRNFQNTHFEKNLEDGGILVPQEFMTAITKKQQSDESLFARTRQITVTGNNLTLPTDETTPWSGGVKAYWMAEGAPYTSSKHKLGSHSWKLHKLGALVKVTDELLEDSTALESYITAMAPEAIVHEVNSAIISGDGAGKPTGLLNSGFKIKVAKESGQLADTIVARNIIKMYSKLIPAARAGAVWYINPMVEEQLRTMKSDSGDFIYLAPGSQMNQQPYGLLMGLQVLPLLGGMKELGTEGDVILANLNYYYTISKGAVQQAMSQHLYFDQGIQAFRFTMRLDGACPFKTPVKTEFGNYEMSAIITLEDRA